MEIRLKHQYTNGDIILDLSKNYRINKTGNHCALHGTMKLTNPNSSYHSEFHESEFVATLSKEQVELLIENKKFNDEFEEKIK